MKKRERAEGLLKELEDVLSILPFEKKLGFTRGRIYKFLKDKRKLNNSDVEIIDNYFQNLITKFYD